MTEVNAVVHETSCLSGSGLMAPLWARARLFPPLGLQLMVHDGWWSAKFQASGGRRVAKAKDIHDCTE